MPGIFGGIGCTPEACSALRREFTAAWPETRVLSLSGGGMLGGHAFGSAGAVHESPGGWLAGVDGERSVYPLAAAWAAGRADALFVAAPGGVDVAPGCRGNVAVVEPGAGVLHLATEWTGSFPLYYAEHASGLLFSSLLRPLARAVGAPRDDLGILQFLRQAFTYAGRTQFAGIRRLLPGQSVSFRDGSLRLAERSRAWVGTLDPSGHEAVPEQAWSLLSGAIEGSVAGGERSTLMMSAGWDSRTLLGAARGGGAAAELSCYCHGDVRSRELELVERICRGEGVPSFIEPIDDRVWDPEALQRGFARVENVVFPHWHRAGRLLADTGVRAVFAGVYGEVLGGHYGPAMLAGGGKKIASVAGALLGRDGRDSEGEGLPPAREALRLGPLGRHWYLRPDFEDSLAWPLEAFNADVETDLDRLEGRGVAGRNPLIEAFVSEHRGTQYINAQILSCRAAVDVVLPFADREAFVMATRLPLHAKIHNRVNRAMLRRFAPRLLRYPLAATLVSAGAPLMLQEASRLARSVWETARWRMHFRAPRAVDPPRLGWVNFEFLRSGRALHALIDDLRADLWDRDALRRVAAEVQDRSWNKPVHPVYDQLSKVYTTDLLLR